VFDRLNVDGGFDVIGDILETLRFRGSIFFRSELAAPWGMSLEMAGVPRFHVALSGDCYVGGNANDTVAVQEMDIIMLPSGNSHWIADEPGRELIPSSRAGAACELGEPLFQRGKITNRLLCGIVKFDPASSHPLLETLPDILHFPKLATTDPIWLTVTLIDTEMKRGHRYSEVIVDRLTEVLFLQLLHKQVESGASTTGFLAAMRDRRIHKALSLIHRDPAFNWTLESLGQQINMSRATLVRKFQDAVGVAPMAYVSNWRIEKAHNLISYSTRSLEDIADTTGFASARTLGKAYQRRYARTPSETRRSKAN
jgi:AraC-like DNA-binding protein